MLARMWSKKNTPPLLLGMETCTVTMEINITVHQSLGNQSPQELSTTVRHIANRYFILPQEYLLNLYGLFTKDSKKYLLR